jgi:LytR cell envelope-related transcriptional attenuator
MNLNFRTPFTLVLLIAVLIFGIMAGWRLLTEEVPSLRESTGTSEPSCQVREFKAGSTLDAGQVTVNVLNSGSTPNLAGDTMRALTRRGFEGGLTGNAPQGVRADSVVILDPDPKSSQVRLVAKQFDERIDVEKSSDNDPAAVDIIVGNDFRVSSGIDHDAPTSMKVKGTTDVCIPAPPDADG